MSANNFSGDDSSSNTPAESRLDSMYQEILLEHSRDPRNFRELPDASLCAEGYNPLCGDKVRIQVKMGADGKTEAVCFKGEACSICTASASMLTEEASSKTFPQILELIASFRALMQGQKDPSEFEGDLSSLVGVRHFPVRIKCALLPWTTLKDAIEGRAST